ncbi:MAG: SDR family NAD(P)-dependent oxidoreductase [Candidatus Omnitrophota bacterium]|nr:MAG: SDR family NAD(P)-dependent oxidoreductase [Candidatus Omnitrophota bacterium]
MDLKGKKVLITGSEGFIGSHLVERLLESGCNVRTFVYYNFYNSWGWLDTFPKDKLNKIEIITGNIRDPNNVQTAVKGADVIFHLAALIGIPFSYRSPESYVDTNIKGTLNIMQAAMDSGVEKILVASTSEVYGSARYVPINEEHPRQGQSPYSATKIGADYIAQSFHKSFGLPVVIARPFNTYGPRQSARAIIPTIITQLLSEKSRIKLGALNPTRDFVFVKDVAEAMVEIAESDKTTGEEINIASQTEISIGELAHKLINMINPESKLIKDTARLRPENSEVTRLLGSNKKIMELTNWKAKYNLDKGLKETIEWFKNKENLKLYKSDIYNV